MRRHRMLGIGNPQMVMELQSIWDSLGRAVEENGDARFRLLQCDQLLVGGVRFRGVDGDVEIVNPGQTAGGSSHNRLHVMTSALDHSGGIDDTQHGSRGAGLHSDSISVALGDEINRPSDNLCLDPSFESTDSTLPLWTMTASGEGVVPTQSSARSQHGKYSCKLSVPSLGAGTDYSQVESSFIPVDYWDVAPYSNIAYQGGFFASSLNGNEQVSGWMDWYDSAQAFLSSSTIVGDMVVTAAWKATGLVVVTPPATARWAKIRVRQVETGATTGDVYVDNVHVQRLMPNRVEARKNSAGDTYNRRRVNFIEGANVTLTLADDASDEEIDLTIAAAGGANHNLLDGSVHPDSTAGTVVRGDVITGQGATPKWTRLAKGTANQVLSMDGTATDVLWATPSTGGTGRLLGVSVLTSGTSFTTSSSTNSILVELLGGGGGGGGTTGGTGYSGAGGGGGASGYARKLFAVSPSTSYTYAIGAAGTGGANTGGTGGTGGNSTFAVGAVTVTANGGSGGVGMTGAGTALFVLGGAGGLVSTNGDLNCVGQPGGKGERVSVTVFASGEGAPSLFGGGGIGLIAAANGNAGGVYGSGGGGATSSGVNTSRTGGAGAQGVIVVWEFS